VDDLFHKGDKEVDPVKRVQFYQDGQKLMVEDLPALWLWEKSYPIAVRKGVVGLPSGAAHSEGYVGVGWAK
jgi:ABC-type transport system substrate-binding protein